MKLKQLFLTKNECYKAGRKITPKGRIKGVMKVGMVWIIPSMAIKPADNRKKRMIEIYFMNY